MSAAIWPGLLVAVACWALSWWRMGELALRAPVDAEALARELTRRLTHGEHARALALCDALRAGWGAQLAARALRAVQREGEALRDAVNELEVEYAHASQQGVSVLAALQRIAIPLALGVSIVVLGTGFDARGPSGIAAAAAQHALQAALQALTIGLATWVFGRVAAGVLLQLGAARMAEVRRVAKALLELDHALGKYSA